MVAELLYLEKQGATLPIEMLINSSGTTRQDGEIVSVVWEYYTVVLASGQNLKSNTQLTMDTNILALPAACLRLRRHRTNIYDGFHQEPGEQVGQQLVKVPCVETLPYKCLAHHSPLTANLRHRSQLSTWGWLWDGPALC
jgi:hypothetical protein